MGILVGSCFESEPNFTSIKSVFQVLSCLETENIKLKEIADKCKETPNLAKNCLEKSTTIINFLKNKPLYYVDERLSRFTDILTRFYVAAYRYDIDTYNQVKEELQEFILHMMDFYNGIRTSIIDNNRNMTETNEIEDESSETEALQS